MPSNEAITRHHDDPPGADPYVPGRRPAPSQIRIVEYQEQWPADFGRVAARIREALGPAVLELHHVGSTSVPGLPAKPVIDVDLVVVDPADESAYIPALEAKGFVHLIREPWWHEHRLLKHQDPLTHLHVFGPDCAEVIRHLMFREWLLERPDERELYAEAKRAAARHERPTWWRHRNGVQPAQGACCPPDLRSDLRRPRSSGPEHLMPIRAG